MLTRRCLAVPALLAALLGFFAVPSSAAPADGILLRGSRSAWIDVTVYANATIAPGDIELKTKGSYVGFFLSPAPANRDTVGVLSMPRVAASPIKLGQSWDVRAGKYRMFLLTDGAAEVFVPIDGQGFRGWVPRGHAPVSLRRMDFDVAAGTGNDGRAVPLMLRQRSLVVAAALVSSSSLTAVDQLTACVEAVGSCAAGAPRVPLSSSTAASSGIAPAGGSTVSLGVTRAGGMDAGSHVDGMVLIMTIGRQT